MHYKEFGLARKDWPFALSLLEVIYVTPAWSIFP